MQKLCCVCTRQQFSASFDYFVTSSPPYRSPSILNHFWWELYQIYKSHRLTPKLTSPINAIFNKKTILSEEEDSESEQEQHNLKQGSSPDSKPSLLPSLQPELPTSQLSNIKNLQNKILSIIFSTRS